MSSGANRKIRKIHILLPEDLHRELRVRCAVEDTSIQQYVASLIAHDMKHYEVPRRVHQEGLPAQRE
jgi:plasmid stability protein